MNRNEHSILYVMRHVDIGGNIDIPYKKVGITGAGSATLNSRLQQISNTKSPIKAQCIAAWKYDNAKSLENALHMLLDDSRVEGEWFLDKDDTLVDRMSPIMELLGANEIEIEQSNDAYTRSILKKEEIEKEKYDHILLGEISELLENPLRSKSRKIGPSFTSDKTGIAYYIAARKSGNHNLSFGKSERMYEEFSQFLEGKGYDVDQGRKGRARMTGVPVELVAEVINVVESGFIPPNNT